MILFIAYRNTQLLGFLLEFGVEKGVFEIHRNAKTRRFYK